MLGYLGQVDSSVDVHGGGNLLEIEAMLTAFRLLVLLEKLPLSGLCLIGIDTRGEMARSVPVLLDNSSQCPDCLIFWNICSANRETEDIFSDKDHIIPNQTNPSAS